MFKIKYHIKYEIIKDDTHMQGWDILTQPFFGSLESLLYNYLTQLSEVFDIPEESICISQISKLN